MVTFIMTSLLMTSDLLPRPTDWSRSYADSRIFNDAFHLRKENRCKIAMHDTS